MIQLCCRDIYSCLLSFKNLKLNPSSSWANQVARTPHLTLPVKAKAFSCHKPTSTKPWTCSEPHPVPRPCRALRSWRLPPSPSKERDLRLSPDWAKQPEPKQALLLALCHPRLPEHSYLSRVTGIGLTEYSQQTQGGNSCNYSYFIEAQGTKTVYQSHENSSEAE